MSAYRFSANLGFLWKDLPVLERIGRARAAGFDALEFHDDLQRLDPGAVRAALADAGLPVVGLNVRGGETAGCAAISGMAATARQDIADAVTVADMIGAGAIHVLAGKTDADDARDTFCATLRFALDAFNGTILIEPICPAMMPGYYLDTIEKAAAIIGEIEHPRLKIMFDCFHIRETSGDVLAAFETHADMIGHVQIASHPERSEPFPGDLDYRRLLPAFRARGYNGAYGCEYFPAGTVEAGLGWREPFAAAKG